MNEVFREYLADIGMPSVLIERVEYFHDLYASLLPLPLDGIFVTDVVSDDTTRAFESLWFFAGPHALEAHSFVQEESFDLALMNQIDYWRVEQLAYDFREATPDSRMKITFASVASSGDLRATGRNCDYLRDLLKSWIVPRSIATDTSPRD